MKVKAKICFTDLKAGVDRNIGDEFEVDEKRYGELSNHPQFGAMVEAVEKEPAAKRTAKRTTKKE